MTIKEELALEDENEEYEDGEDFELSTSQAIQEISDELSVVSELLEQLVSVMQEKLEQDKQFQEKLIATLERCALKGE